MTEIVNFPTKEKQPEPLIWVCDCGCSTFELLSDGAARCALCQEAINDGGWLVPATDKEWDGDDPVRDVSGNGEPNFARRVTSKRVLEEDTVLVVVVKQDGTVSTWTCMETEEQRQWAKRQLDRVPAILKTGRE